MRQPPPLPTGIVRHTSRVRQVVQTTSAARRHCPPSGHLADSAPPDTYAGRVGQRGPHASQPPHGCGAVTMSRCRTPTTTGSQP
ncbi:hypothetical protein ATKI12_1107 [Kitasatospora sp. Ki12]